MPDMISNRTQTLVLNGDRVTGFSDANPAVEVPEVTNVEETFGQDGRMYIQGTNMRGGEMVVHLQATSPMVPKWMRMHARIQNGDRSPDLYGLTAEFGDTTLGYNLRCEGGILKMARQGISPGQDADFTFLFEEMIIEYDNVTFTPAPYTT